MLSVQECARGLNLVVLLLCTKSTGLSELIPLLGESVSPFIDEGDGLTRERIRIRVSGSHEGGGRS